ncbi:MAG: polyprenyl synthetase family protein [Acidobacteriota bacterium]
MPLPVISLPPTMPILPARETQDDIPDTKAERDAIQDLVRAHLAAGDLVPPMPMDELKAEALELCAAHSIDEEYAEFTALLINNELWKDTLATIPFERRLLLLPKCLRVEDRCPAPFDEFGLLCKKCGLCTIQDLQTEAERLGYAVLVAEGSPLVMAIIETGKIDAIVGVSCLNVLRKVYSYMEAAAVPGIALPLLQDDCIDTNVDLDWVWDSIHLTSDDKTRRMDLMQLRDEVDGWFQDDELERLLGSAETETERIGRDWLARAGKRWRPFLTVAIHQALQDDPGGEIADDLRRVAVAVECFHKASLIHDDIEDADTERYGVKTLHEEQGVPVALNVGDYLLGEGYRLLAESTAPAEVRAEMMRVAAEGHRTLSVGQGAELVWQRRPTPLKPVEVVDIFQRKTAPAFETALRLGAVRAGVLGEEGAELHEALASYSRSMGIAYQIQDDLDDLGQSVEAAEMPELRPTILWALAHQGAKGPRKTEVAATWTGGEGMDVAAVYRLFSDLDIETRGQELLGAYKDEAIRSLRLLGNANVKGLLRRTLGKIFNDLEIKGWCNEFEARNAAGGETRAAAAG